MAGKGDETEICRAVWYWGNGPERAKHVCHRDHGHRGGHHSDARLNWSRNPHARRVRESADPCPDCELVGAGKSARR
jgi:hypothetical protein